MIAFDSIDVSKEIQHQLLEDVNCEGLAFATYPESFPLGKTTRLGTPSKTAAARPFESLTHAFHDQRKLI